MEKFINTDDLKAMIKKEAESKLKETIQTELETMYKDIVYKNQSLITSLVNEIQTLTDEVRAALEDK